MGAADVVPGVSGGTVALLLGIYDRLIGEVRAGAGAVAHLARGDLRGGWARLRSVDWVFLLSLLAGIGIAVVVLVSWLRTQIEENPVEVSAVFFGLVAASVVVARREVERWDALRLAVMLGTAVVAFFVLGLRSGGVTDPSLPVVVAAGSLAICAMILPGISGSFILLMLGLYDHITHAVDERDLGTIAAFGVGAVVGLTAFSTLLNWLLHHHRDTVVASLVGLMLGSLRVLWPWPSGEEGLENVSLGVPVSSELVGAVVGAGLAAIGVVVLTSIARRFDAGTAP
jgi:putative membrane protein